MLVTGTAVEERVRALARVVDDAAVRVVAEYTGGDVVRARPSPVRGDLGERVPLPGAPPILTRLFSPGVGDDGARRGRRSPRSLRRHGGFHRCGRFRCCRGRRRGNGRRLRHERNRRRRGRRARCRRIRSDRRRHGHGRCRIRRRGGFHRSRRRCRRFRYCRIGGNRRRFT